MDDNHPPTRFRATTGPSSTPTAAGTKPATQSPFLSINRRLSIVANRSDIPGTSGARFTGTQSVVKVPTCETLTPKISSTEFPPTELPPTTTTHTFATSPLPSTMNAPASHTSFEPAYTTVSLPSASSDRRVILPSPIGYSHNPHYLAERVTTPLRLIVEHELAGFYIERAEHGTLVSELQHKIADSEQREQGLTHQLQELEAKNQAVEKEKVIFYEEMMRSIEDAIRWEGKVKELQSKESTRVTQLRGDLDNARRGAEGFRKRVKEMEVEREGEVRRQVEAVVGSLKKVECDGSGCGLREELEVVKRESEQLTGLIERVMGVPGVLKVISSGWTEAVSDDEERDVVEVGGEDGTGEEAGEVGGMVGAAEKEAEIGGTDVTAENEVEVGGIDGTAEKQREVGVLDGAAEKEIGIVANDDTAAKDVGVSVIDGTAEEEKEVGGIAFTKENQVETGCNTGSGEVASDVGGTKVIQVNITDAAELADDQKTTQQLEESKPKAKKKKKKTRRTPMVGKPVELEEVEDEHYRMMRSKQFYMSLFGPLTDIMQFMHRCDFIFGPGAAVYCRCFEDEELSAYFTEASELF